MNSGCENFIRAVLGGNWKGALTTMGTLSSDDLFRCLASVDRADLDDLVRQGPPAVTDLFLFAIATVRNGKAPGKPSSFAPADFANALTAHLHRVATQEQPLHFATDLTGTFTTACWSTVPLNDNDYQLAADGLGIETAAIQAVASVESAGSGFADEGWPKIRYELHVFSKETHHKYTGTHPWLSQNSYEAGNDFHDDEQSTEYSMLFNAMILRAHGRRRIRQAIEAASWGKFQIMGSNYGAAGWSDAEGFALDSLVSEANHLKGFINFVKSKNLVKALKGHDWAKFALHYNGSLYKSHDYDGKIARAYNRLKPPSPKKAQGATQ